MRIITKKQQVGDGTEKLVHTLMAWWDKLTKINLHFEKQQSLLAKTPDEPNYALFILQSGRPLCVLFAHDLLAIPRYHPRD